MIKMLIAFFSKSMLCAKFIRYKANLSKNVKYMSTFLHPLYRQHSNPSVTFTYKNVNSDFENS